MRMNGYNIEIIRGESTSVKYTLRDKDGYPLRLITTDTYTFLHAVFKVKEKVLGESSTLVMNKQLDLNTVKRFDSVEVLNIQDYDPVGYNPLQWNNASAPDPTEMNYLFYHPELKDCRYYDDTNNIWVPYTFTITVPFARADTLNLYYKEYVYDLCIEGGDTEGTVDYLQVLVPTHAFSVTYKV